MPPLPLEPLDELDEDDDDVVELDELDVVDDEDELELPPIPPIPPMPLVCPELLALELPLSPSPPLPVRFAPPTAHPCKHVNATGKVKATMSVERVKDAKRRELVVRGFIDVFPCNRDCVHSRASASKHASRITVGT
jgi:hypothetical protein